jgi:hypothetical protein
MKLLRGVGPSLDSIEPEFRFKVNFKMIERLWQEATAKSVWVDLYEGLEAPSNITLKFEGKIDHIFSRGPVLVHDRLTWRRS